MLTLPDDFSATLLSRPFNRWLVRVCAFVAAALCGWLAWQKTTGVITSLAGCGQAYGCTQVLGGRWSQWLGIPVSFLACGFYLGVLLLSFELVQNWFSMQADRLLLAAALLAIGCGVWFVGLLGIVERTFCPYCAAAHGLGIIFAIPLLQRAWRLRHEETRGLFASAFSVALPALLILIVGQLFGTHPDTHVIVDQPLPVVAQAAHPIARPGSLQFFDGALNYPIAELPRLGTLEAPHHLVEYFDYTCGSCRDMSGDFEALLQRFPGAFCITLLPCPLNRACNRYCGPKVLDHPDACELATYALAVWKQAPTVFPAFHADLMHLPIPVDLAAVKARAEKACGGAETLASAMTDPWITARLTETFEEYRLLVATDAVMPKLLLHDSRVMNGAAKDTATFLQFMQTEFKLK